MKEHDLLSVRESYGTRMINELGQPQEPPQRRFLRLLRWEVIINHVGDCFD